MNIYQKELRHTWSKSQKAEYNRQYYQRNKDYWIKWRMDHMTSTYRDPDSGKEYRLGKDIEDGFLAYFYQKKNNSTPSGRVENAVQNFMNNMGSMLKRTMNSIRREAKQVVEKGMKAVKSVLSNLKNEMLRTNVIHRPLEDSDFPRNYEMEEAVKEDIRRENALEQKKLDEFRRRNGG